MTPFRLMPPHRARRGLSVAAIVAAGTLVTAALGTVSASASTNTHVTTYRQINLMSDQKNKAPLKDPDLVNA